MISLALQPERNEIAGYSKYCHPRGSHFVLPLLIISAFFPMWSMDCMNSHTDPSPMAARCTAATAVLISADAEGVAASMGPAQSSLGYSCNSLSSQSV